MKALHLCLLLDVLAAAPGCATCRSNSGAPPSELLIASNASVNIRDHVGAAPLMKAVYTRRAGSESSVALLLEHGANVTATCYAIKLTPLHLAANNGTEKLLTLLLDKGAEVDAVDAEGFTPLLNAIERGHLKAADLLMAHGANPRATTRDRRNALHIASGHNRPDILQWAVDHGCDVASRDKNGQTALTTPRTKVTPPTWCSS